MPLDRGALDLATFCIWGGIGRSQAYEEAKKGRLRLTKCGRRTLVTLEDAKAWLAALPKSPLPPKSEGSE
jgi:hypothetical protein